MGAFLLVVSLLPGSFAAATPAEPDFLAMSMEDLLTFKVPLVYAASKRAQRQSEAPSSVSIVTADDIRHYGYRTLGAMLNSLRGFDVTNDRTYSFLGVRGFNRPGDYGGRNLLMVDGHRTNEALFDSTFFEQEFALDVDLIDRVEVVRGPGSALYGNNAFFSVINVIPKRGQDIQRCELSAGAGSLHAYQGRFTLGRRLSATADILLSGSFYAQEGEGRIRYVSADPARPLPNGGVAEQLDEERAHSIFLRMRLGDLTLAGGHASREKATSPAVYASTGAVFNDPFARNTDRPSYVDLKFERLLDHDWSILARLGYNRYVYFSPQQFDYVGLGDPADYTVNYNQTRSQALGAEVQVGKTLSGRHVITAGAEFRELFDNFYQNEDVHPAFTYLSINPHERTWGLFANAEVQLFRADLMLHAGVRYDGFSAFDSALSPRAALIAHPWVSTAFKLTHGRAYRTPNIYESVYNQTWDTPGEEAPRPERIRSYEASWEQTYGRQVRTSVSAFWNQITDLIDTDPTRDRLINIGRVSGRGVEFEVEGQVPSGWRGRFSLAAQTTRDARTQRTLTNSPRVLAKLNVVVPLLRERIFAGLELQHHGAVDSVYDTRIADYRLLNVTVFGRELVRGCEITASVQNLLNRAYAFPASPSYLQAELPQVGRTLRLKVTWKL